LPERARSAAEREKLASLDLDEFRLHRSCWRKFLEPA
jgi:hypothetical protein